jgi:ferric-dicitrate binding protein FerR (iron transport regulator)
MTDRGSQDDELFGEWPDAEQQRLQQALSQLQGGVHEGVWPEAGTRWTNIAKAINADDSLVKHEGSRESSIHGAATPVRRSQLKRVHVWSQTAFFATVAVLCVAFVVSNRTMRNRFTLRDTERVYTTTRGEQRTLTLGNGTRITLAPATTVRMRGAVADLTGEAYFEVASHDRTSFVVQTGRITTRVLGTAFTVRRYPSDSAVRVAVIDGRVSTGTSRAPITISAGQAARVTDSIAVLQSSDDAMTATAWTRGQLVFKWVPLRDVVGELSRVYGTEVRVTDTTLAKETVRLDVSIREQSLNQVLDVIGAIVNARAVKSGNAFMLTPGRDRRGNRYGGSDSHHITTQERSYGR